MPESEDIVLLRQYAESGSQSAFTTLVERHINLVYSVALRRVGRTHAAEEISQAVFIILAKKAPGLSRRTVLSGWLYKAARLTAANYLRTEIRRQRREQEAYMQTTSNEPEPEVWLQIAPLLDAALDQLGEKDRNAIVLRFLENKNLREVGHALGTSEDAAKMRVNRALEKLRVFFKKRDVLTTGAIIGGAVSSNSVQAAPAGMAKTITAAALAKGATTSISTLSLVKGALKTMAWTKAKTALIAGVGILLAGIVTVVTVYAAGSDDSRQVLEIVSKTRDAYAALTSYSDQGQTVAEVNGMALTTKFSIELARPDLYRVQWSQPTDYFTNGGSAWSDGNGNFVGLKFGLYVPKPGRYSSREAALSSATGVSAGAAGSIPGIFFDMNSGNLLCTSMQSARKMPDEKIGGVDCYVLTLSKEGRKRTWWIGKKDFLIHRIETKTSAAVLKATLDAEAKKHPQMNLPTAITGALNTVETHSNIVLNRNLSPANFGP